MPCTQSRLGCDIALDTVHEQSHPDEEEEVVEDTCEMGR